MDIVPILSQIQEACFLSGDSQAICAQELSRLEVICGGLTKETVGTFLEFTYLVSGIFAQSADGSARVNENPEAWAASTRCLLKICSKLSVGRWSELSEDPACYAIESVLDCIDAILGSSPQPRSRAQTGPPKSLLLTLGISLAAEFTRHASFSDDGYLATMDRLATALVLLEPKISDGGEDGGHGLDLHGLRSRYMTCCRVVLKLEARTWIAVRQIFLSHSGYNPHSSALAPLLQANSHIFRRLTVAIAAATSVSSSTSTNTNTGTGTGTGTFTGTVDTNAWTKEPKLLLAMLSVASSAASVPPSPGSAEHWHVVSRLLKSLVSKKWAGGGPLSIIGGGGGGDTAGAASVALEAVAPLLVLSLPLPSLALAVTVPVPVVTLGAVAGGGGM